MKQNNITDSFFEDNAEPETEEMAKLRAIYRAKYEQDENDEEWIDEEKPEFQPRHYLLTDGKYVKETPEYGMYKEDRMFGDVGGYLLIPSHHIVKEIADAETEGLVECMPYKDSLYKELYKAICKYESEPGYKEIYETTRKYDSLHKEIYAAICEYENYIYEFKL